MTLAQPLRFIFVGGVTFVIYFGLQYGLEKAGLRPYTSLSAAYAVAIIYHYLMNRTYTFRNSLALEGTSTSLAKYAIINIIHYFVTLGIVAGARSLGLDMRIGMVAAVAVTTVNGYLTCRHWVFASDRRAEENSMSGPKRVSMRSTGGGAG